MKKIVTVLVLLMLTAPVLMAQNTLKDVVRDYQRQNSEFTMVIPSFIMKFGLAFGDLDDDEREALKAIDNMKIVISEQSFHNNDLTLLNDGIKSGKFVEVMTVHDHKERVRMVVNQKNKRKSELLMLVEDGSENVMILMNLHGEPDFSKFISLAD
ncbi:MAG: DUF4252 domain-containing protein [Bacteroidales bacterium]